MDINLTRRAFFGGATAWAVWPKDLFGASKDKTAQRPSQVSAWEKPDGTATDAVMVRRLYLDLAGRIPTRDEAQAYVYSADPKLDPTAVKFDRIRYDEVLAKRLAVMDSTATSLAMDNAIPVIVFALAEPENILRVLAGEAVGTTVE